MTNEDPTHDDQDSRQITSVELFGIPGAITRADAEAQIEGLERLFQAQVRALASLGRPEAARHEMSVHIEHRAISPRADELMRQDLEILRAWFDPTAKGERVREAVTSLPAMFVRLPFDGPRLVLVAGKERQIVTPEGRALTYCLRSALNQQYSAEGWDWVSVSNEDLQWCGSLLLSTYRTWSRRRIDDVLGLLTSETSTLRPAAAGLLLTLLINRNTSIDRALPRPQDKRQLQVVSDAIAGPAAAYATALTGSGRTDARSLDLYRGWPLGELRRRLGTDLHTDFESGIYIEPHAVDDAVSRLTDDIRRRSPRARQRVPAALDQALQVYGERRPQLAGLGLAFERPAYTRRLIDALRQAAIEGDVEDTPRNELDG